MERKVKKSAGKLTQIHEHAQELGLKTKTELLDYETRLVIEEKNGNNVSRLILLDGSQCGQLLLGHKNAISSITYKKLESNNLETAFEKFKQDLNFDPESKIASLLPEIYEYLELYLSEKHNKKLVINKFKKMNPQ